MTTKKELLKMLEPYNDDDQFYAEIVEGDIEIFKRIEPDGTVGYYFEPIEEY